ncbi:MAG: hypothetical protein LBS58_03660 [Coriobacteriales bacterium]|jgi:hypothetical protein|nr:hypothetical protein [Coriobacteriales bacterium]
MSITYAHINHESSGSASQLMQQLTVATNLNASGLAHAMKVAPSTVTRILHGQVCPSYDDMMHYAYCLGFKVEGTKLSRLDHLRGYRSPKEIGDFVNAELANGLNSKSLDVILRYIPKTTMDWQELCDEDKQKLMLQPARVDDIRFQALIEGTTRFFSHAKMWQDAPAWTTKTRLEKLFVPRAAVREIGNRWYQKILGQCNPVFIQKNILFATSEMQVI